MLRHRVVPFEIKSSEPDGSSFTGYAACYNNVDAYRHILAPGCFNDSLSDFIHNDGFIGGMNHNWDEPVGRPTDVKEDANGLMVTGSVVETAHGKDVRILLSQGIVRKLSIGFMIKGHEYLEDADAVKEYWKSNSYKPSAQDEAMSKYGALLVTKGVLKEASPVMFPANDRADIIGVKSEDPDLLGIEVLQKLCNQVRFLTADPKSVEYIQALGGPLMKDLLEALSPFANPPREDPSELGSLEKVKYLKAAHEQVARFQALLAGV